MQKFLSIGAIAATGLVLALAPAASTIYGEAFPQDNAKRAALAACASADPGFSRLTAADRAACYVRLLHPPQVDSPLPPRRQELADSGVGAVL